MPKIPMLLPAFICLYGAAAGQRHQFSLSGAYGIIGLARDTRISSSFDQNFYVIKVADYRTVSFTFNYENHFNKHFTIAANLSRQVLEPEEAYAEPYQQPQFRVAYLINRRVMSLSPEVRWYPSEVYNGFFAGTYLSFNYMMVKTAGYTPSVTYHPLFEQQPNTHGFGIGVMAGYRLKLDDRIRLSVQGNCYHATYYVKNNTTAFGAQFSLGFNYLL